MLIYSDINNIPSG